MNTAWAKVTKRPNPGTRFTTSFCFLGWLYMRGLAEPCWTEALITGAIWAGITIVFDVFAWVIIKHPWSLSFKEFYVDYQPWITLIYLAIFAGPLAGYLILTI